MSKDKDKLSPSSITVKDSRVSELLQKTGEAMSADENQELIEELKAQNTNYAEQIKALTDSKMEYMLQNDNEIDKELIRNAYVLGRHYSPDNIFNTKLGEIAQKAVSTVGRFQEAATRQIEKELEQQLVVAPLFRRMEVEAKSLDIPVSDEDTDLGVRQVPSGQFALGSGDVANTTPRVQNTVNSVQLTPHTFISATFLAKEEEENFALPLVSF